jgi:lipoate-protein ligase A
MKTVLQHGTVLLDVDVEKMFSLLLVPNEKIRDKMIADVKQRVTSVKTVLGNYVSFNDSIDAMKKGFEEEFKINLVEDSLTDYEKDLTDKFEKECFGNTDWNHKR